MNIFHKSHHWKTLFSFKKKKIQEDMVMDDFIYLEYVHLTIYINFFLLPLVVVFEKKKKSLTGTLENAFFAFRI